MIAAVLVVLFGMAVGCLGLVVPDLYAVGTVVVLIGAIGVLTRAGDWYRWIRTNLES